MTRFLAVLALIVLAAAPARAIDWPVAETPTLDIALEGVTARFPAPPWIDRAVHEGVEDEASFTGHWFISGGFDMVSGQVRAQLTVSSRWRGGLTVYLSSVRGACDHTVLGRLPREGSPSLVGGWALCGKDYGTGRGYVLFGLTRRTGKTQLFDILYETPVDAFNSRDEGAWPMSRDDLEATARTLDATIAIEGIP